MANAPKPKGTPSKAAKTSQSPNQPKGPTNPPEDERDDLGPEDAEPDADADDEVVIEHDSEADDEPAATPPVIKDDLDSPAQASAPAGPGSVTSPPNVGSSVDPVTGRPINPVTRRPHGIDEKGRDEVTGEQVVNPPPKKVREVGDRIKDIETRWDKGIQEVLIDIHDHIFGTSRPHEEVKAEREAKAKAAE